MKLVLRKSSAVVCLRICLLSLGWLELQAVQAGPNHNQKLWVATIAVDKYPQLPAQQQLQCCARDAAAFLERVRAGTAIPDDQVLRIDQEQFSHSRQPTRENILSELPRFLQQADEQSAIVLFLSLHGAQWQRPGDRRPRTFLVPADVNPQRLEESLIDIDWLRELLGRQVRAKTVVVFLDACHSGGIGGLRDTAEVSPLSTRSIEVMFSNQPPTQANKSIYILTSCGENEKSLEEPQQLRQGVFTHWLVQGLDGAADANADAIISMDELFQFVETQVPLSAMAISRRLGKPVSQTPRRVLCGADQGDVRLFPLPLQTAERALDKLARLVDSVLRNQETHPAPSAGRSRLGLLEFGSLVPGGEHELRGPLGSFGAIGRELLERRLIELSQRSTGPSGYKVVPVRQWQSQLKSIGLEQILQDRIPAGVSGEDRGVDALLVGTCTRRGENGNDAGPDRLSLELTLLDLNTSDRLARLGMTILVNEELWNLLGGSRDVRQATRINRQRPVQELSAISPAPVQPASQSHRTSRDSDSQAIHPQLASSDPTVEIQVWQGAPSRPKQLAPWMVPQDGRESNRLAFETTAGQELELHIRNLTDELLAVIVQIDGVNQFGRNIQLPSESLYWFLEPRQTIRIDQWIDTPQSTAAGSSPPAFFDTRGSRLLVTEPPRSVAGQQNYWDQLGEIRVLVYGTQRRHAGTRGQQSLSGGLGIGEGQQQQNRVRVIPDRVIDHRRSLSTNVIRYCEKSSN